MTTKTDLHKSLKDILAIPSQDPCFPPLIEEVGELVRSEIASNETLRRYQTTQKRMGKKSQYSLAPPNFQYVISAA